VTHCVLLLAHGAPERVEDVEAYLARVRGGRMPEHVVREVEHRYAAIGGGSPLLRWTEAQAAALEQTLGLPVFIGMRNWLPTIDEAMQAVRAAGIEKLAAICLAPQYSDLSVGLYMRRAEEARTAAGVTAEMSWARSFHDHPLLVEAFAERLAPVATPGRTVVFTAHSLPERALAADDPYDRECRATAGAVAARLQLTQWEFAYQSQGMTNDRWLGPTVESTLDRLTGEVVVAPIGFVCDHVEVLYDIDVAFRNYAADRGLTLFRPESLNESPTFTAALAEVAQQCLA
jgi:protoporphyrin/coproporphyrin ferrochelatase